MKSGNRLPLLMIFFVLLSLACSKPQEPLTSLIEFDLEGYGRDTIRIWQFERLGHERVNSQELVADGSGSGSFEIAYPYNSFVYLQVGDFVFTIFHTPGADLKIRGKASDLAHTLTISGKGSLPSNYIFKKNSIIQKYNQQDGMYFFQLDSTAFRERIRALNEEMDSLNAWLATQRMDPEIEALLVLESKQQSNAFRLNYALVKGYTGSEFSVEIPYDEDLFNAYSTGYNMAMALNYEFQLNGPAWRASGASDYDSIANIFPGLLSEKIQSLDIPDFAKDFYTARLLLSYFGSNLSSPVVEEVYARWLSSYPNSVFGSTISNAIDGMARLAPGEQAPIVTGIDPGGHDFTTGQLKGKVLYIDVWATWCSACIDKIPGMYALQEEFKDQDRIRFLFVSVDRDLEKWRNFLSRFPAGGLHINAGNTGIYQDYQMGGIPHYMIVDASGNIFRSNAPEPDSEEIKDLLLEAMKQAG